MSTFHLTPQINKVNQYINLGIKQIVIDEIQFEDLSMDLDWPIFSDASRFEADFKILLTKYNLKEHYDNLLYITLSIFDQTWAEIQHYHDNYSSQKRAKEMAQLLILLKENPAQRLDIVTFKTYKGAAKLTDPTVNEWISKVLVEAIENGNFPLNSLGNNVLQMLSDHLPPNKGKSIDVKKLKIVANRRTVNWKKHLLAAKFKICIPLYSYLQNETALQAAQGTKTSDAQLNFLFDLLVLLKQVNSLAIDSLPKDYMRIGLNPYIDL